MWRERCAPFYQPLRDSRWNFIEPKPRRPPFTHVAEIEAVLDNHIDHCSASHFREESHPRSTRFLV